MTEDKMMEVYEDELYGMYEMMDAEYEEYAAERDYEMQSLFFYLENC